MTKICFGKKLAKRAVLMLACLMLAGCGHMEKNAEIAEFMEVFISVYAPQDEMSFTYLKAMGDMAAVLKSDGTHIEEAVSILTEAHDKIEKVAVSEFTPDADMEAYMKKKLLSVEELTGLARMASDDQKDYLEVLEVYVYALETGVADGSISAEWMIQEAEFRIELQRLINQYHYYAGNEFFSVLKGDDLEYVRTCLHDRLSMYQIDGVEWQDNADDAFEKQEDVWKQIEALDWQN